MRDPPLPQSTYPPPSLACPPTAAPSSIHPHPIHHPHPHTAPPFTSTLQTATCPVSPPPLPFRFYVCRFYGFYLQRAPREPLTCYGHLLQAVQQPGLVEGVQPGPGVGGTGVSKWLQLELQVPMI